MCFACVVLLLSGRVHLLLLREGPEPTPMLKLQMREKNVGNFHAWQTRLCWLSLLVCPCSDARLPAVVIATGVWQLKKPSLQQHVSSVWCWA